MGSKLRNDDMALTEAKKIPYECREYLSHHVRNGLLGMLSIIILEAGETSETYDRVSILQKISKRQAFRMVNSLFFPDITPRLNIPGDIGAAKSGSNTNILPSDEEDNRKVAAEFEAIFVNQMLKAMRSMVNKESLFDRKTEEFYTSFLDHQLSKVLAQKGIGVAEMLEKEFKVSKLSIDNYIQYLRNNFLRFLAKDYFVKVLIQLVWCRKK